MHFAIKPRSVVLLLVSFTIVSAAICIGLLANAISQETRIARDWMVLVERCRAAIESGLPLDTSELVPAEISRIVPDTSRPSGERILAFPNGRYAITEREFSTGTGVNRVCAVGIVDEWNGPTKREAAVLFYDFAQLAHRLYQDETHWGTKILGGPDFADHGFEPRQPRYEGCMVKSTIFIILETHKVVTTTTEMPGCSGPSFLSGETV